MKRFCPPRATLEVVTLYIGRKALRIEHRLCDAMFHIARHSPTAREYKLRAMAEKKVVADLETELHAALRPTQRDWKWDLRQRRGLAKQMTSAIDKELFDFLIKQSAYEMMYQASYRVCERHQMKILDIAEGDLRDMSYEWGFYAIRSAVKCTARDRNIVETTARTCRMVGYALLGDFM